MQDLQILLHQTISICKQVGAFVKHEHALFETSSIEYKGHNDLVSFVDKEAENKLVAALSVLLPEAGFIAEEGTTDKKGEEYNWIIDPIDGTTNFIHGLPVFAISVALIKGEEIILGVVLEINKDECFYATRGGGAYCNGKPIAISKNNYLKDSLVATGFPYYAFGKMDTYLAILKDFMQFSHGIRRLGSAAVDLVYVACGRFEAFFEYNLKPWDVAAGILIVREAGGVVTDFSNGNGCISGKEVLAANNVHKEALEMIQRSWLAD